jgi:hypothetical protein
LADFILPPCCLVQIGQDCAPRWSTPFMGRKRNQGALRGGCVTSLGSWFWLSSCLRALSPPGRLLNTSIFSLFNLFFHRVLLTPIPSEVRLLLARGTTWKWTTAASVLSACPRSPLTCPSVIATHTRDSVDSLRVHSIAAWDATRPTCVGPLPPPGCCCCRHSRMPCLTSRFDKVPCL